MSRKAGSQPGQNGRKDLCIRLFIANRTPPSVEARQAIDQIIEEHLKDRCTLEVVDVMSRPDLALKYMVLITPTVIVTCASSSERRIVGSLSNRAKLLSALPL